MYNIRMAREQHDRENMLAEAKALVERVSLTLPGCDEEIFAGFRRGGGASFYFGPERTYQANANGQLRRAYVDGLLYKAERGRLVALARQRTSDAVELVRHELSAAEQQAFLTEMRRHLAALATAFSIGSFHTVGQVPKDADVVGRVRAWLERYASEIAVARSPRAG